MAACSETWERSTIIPTETLEADYFSPLCHQHCLSLTKSVHFLHRRSAQLRKATMDWSNFRRRRVGKSVVLDMCHGALQNQRKKLSRAFSYSHI